MAHDDRRRLIRFAIATLIIGPMGLVTSVALVLMGVISPDESYYGNVPFHMAIGGGVAAHLLANYASAPP